MLYLNDQKLSPSAPSGRSILEFIREEQQLKGTKLVCREGDCGACSVLLGSLQADGKLHYQNITSCIAPLANAYGKQIVTIEGLNLKNGRLNRIQQALKEAAATQCGFCTPGFVVALSNMALQKAMGKDLSPRDALSGNICRCTGYKSIERAAKQIFELLQKEKPDLQKLVQLELLPRYFLDIPQKLKELQHQQSSNGQPSFQHTFVGGGTDLYVQQGETLSLGEVSPLCSQSQLSGISVKNNTYHIGAATTISQIWEHPQWQKDFPKLHEMLRLVASLPIRNMATLAGNFVNASPIGDMSIFFLALGARLQLLHPPQNTTREIPLEDFFLDYKKTALQKGELIQSLSCPRPDAHTHFSFEKVSKRTYLDIASVNSALKINIKNQHITEARLATGGVKAIPLFCKKTSDFLKGKELCSKTLQQATEVLQDEIAPISDVRGSASYKRLLAQQLFFAHFIKLFPETFKLKTLLA